MEKQEKTGPKEEELLKKLDLPRYLEDPKYRQEVENGASTRQLLYEVSLAEAASIFANEELDFSSSQIEKVSEALFEYLLKFAPELRCADRKYAEIEMQKKLEMAGAEVEGTESSIATSEFNDINFVSEVSKAQSVDINLFTHSKEYKAILRGRNPLLREVAQRTRATMLGELLSRGIKLELTPEQVEKIIALADRNQKEGLASIARAKGLLPARKGTPIKEQLAQADFADLERKFLAGDIKREDFKKAVDKMLQKYTGPKKPKRNIPIQ